jgi:transposase
MAVQNIDVNMLMEMIQNKDRALAEFSKTNQQLTEQITQLTEQVTYLTQKLYGRKTEKSAVVLDGQLVIQEVAENLFNEAETYADPKAVEPEVFEQPLKKTRAGYKRKNFFENLPVKEMLYSLDTDGQGCPACGGKIKNVGKKFVRSEINFVPAQLSVLNIYQETCECPACKVRTGKTAFIEPKVPAPVLPHSYASASSIAYTMYQKYVQSVPLNRQEKDWKAMGLNLTKSTLSNWILQSSESWLSPIVDYMNKQLLTEKHLHMDETPIQVLQEPGRKNQTKSYMWVMANRADSIHPIRVFRYAPGRSGEYAVKYLDGYDGYLHTDDYSGYNRLKTVKRCLCWAHVRRRFKDAITVKSKGSVETLAEVGFRYCSALFEWEKKFKHMDSKERKEARLKHERPVLDAFWQYIDDNIGKTLPKSKLGMAMAYALDNKAKLETYLEDGNCSIFNNVAENSIRPFSIGRKNWIFAGSPKGADASACIYSLVETAKANGLDPFMYLQCLLMLAPGSNYLKNEDAMKSMMPWSSLMTEKCSIK